MPERLTIFELKQLMLFDVTTRLHVVSRLIPFIQPANPWIINQFLKFASGTITYCAFELRNKKFKLRNNSAFFKMKCF